MERANGTPVEKHCFLTQKTYKFIFDMHKNRGCVVNAGLMEWASATHFKSSPKAETKGVNITKNV